MWSGVRLDYESRAAAGVVKRIELLSLHLLEERALLERLNALLAALGLEIGWHYPLDMVWIVKRLQEAGVSPGATVLDAGAGGGALQFLLAEMGYNVLSVDLAPRRLPRRARLAFSMRLEEHIAGSDDPYVAHLAAVATRSWPLSFDHLWRRARTVIPFAIYAAKTRFSGRARGTITYCRADLADLGRIPTGHVDAVVSVSAVEHMPLANMRRAVDELMRVTRDGGCMCVTTSAAPAETWFHEPSQGWCFSEADLRQIFAVGSDAPGWGDFAAQLGAMRANAYLPARLPRYYHTTGACGMPWGRWDPKYLPVGVFVRKSAAASR